MLCSIPWAWSLALCVGFAVGCFMRLFLGLLLSGVLFIRFPNSQAGCCGFKCILYQSCP